MSNQKMKKVTASELVKSMRIGWSLGNTMDSVDHSIAKTEPATAWETAWGNPVTTESLIHTVIDKGFNVIRIPVSWDEHIVDDNNYEIIESWMDRVQEIVDYAYKYDAYVILNAHHESWYYPYYDNKEKASKKLVAVWSQIAKRFEDYDEHLIFEGMNEPRKIGTPVEWNGGDQEGWDMVNHFNQVFVDTIRSCGGNNPYRVLMLPGYAANCWEALKHVIIPENDDRLILSVHAYEPYDFALNINGLGVWNNDTIRIDNIMNSLDSLFISKGVPVVIGEFGAMFKPVENNEQERAAWAEYYVHTARNIGIPCVWWDNGLFQGDGELFGLIDRDKYEWRYLGVVEGLMKGLD